MKRKKISYDSWACVTSKEFTGKKIDSEWLKGYISLNKIMEVSEPQIWEFRGEKVTICDRGLQWLTILPQDDWYCITAMMDPNGEILLWYIDMIAGQGTDTDGIPYFDDLYLDLIIRPDGDIYVDDMDELEDALLQKDITQEQYDLALETYHRLEKALEGRLSAFAEYTRKCYRLIEED